MEVVSNALHWVIAGAPDFIFDIFWLIEGTYLVTGTVRNANP
jgi:hypothetical protein